LTLEVATASWRKLGSLHRNVIDGRIEARMSVTDTGGPITVPVGEGVLGRLFNVTGDTIDNRVQ